MKRNISIRTAKKVYDYIWPEFKEVDGLILLAWERSIPIEPEKGWDHTGVEAYCNHTHMVDLFRSGLERENETREEFTFDYDHPDFQVLCEVAKMMAECWLAKLKRDFPHYRFRVYYTQYDNPIVRFHRVRDNEGYWIYAEDNEDAIRNGEIIIYDTGEMPGHDQQ